MMCNPTNPKIMIDKSKYKITDTPQDCSFIPTLGVTLWLGCFAASFYLVILAVVIPNIYIRSIIFGTMTISLLLPRDFPKKYSRLIGNWIALQARKYFGLKTVIEDVGSLHQKCSQCAGNNNGVIFACEPHDILPYSVMAFNPILKVLPGKLGEDGCVLMTSAAFQAPFTKQVFSWVGGDNVDKLTFRKRLQEGKPLAFCPGGVQEVIYMDNQKPEEIILFLHKRKGFVKLALEHGSPIVPVFTFNLDGSYGYFLPKGKIVAWLARTIGFLPVLFWGRGYIPLGIPFAQKICVVFGTPIDIPKMDKSDIHADVVDKYHAVFVEEMIALFERHKHDEGYGERTLNIL